MNKLKLLLATLTASALALGGGVLAACSDNDKQEEDKKPPVTSVPDDDDEDDVTPPPVTGGDEDDDDDNNKPPVTGGDEDDDDDDNKPPVTATEYEITLQAGEGTISTTKLTTSGGKLTNLPAPTAPEGYVFIGWYNAETDGMKVDGNTVFEGDATLYARYNVQLNVTILVTKAGQDSPEEAVRLAWLAPGDSALRQYTISEFELAVGDSFIFQVDGEPITHTNEFGLWATGSHGVNFNQSTGVYTVKNGQSEERAFTVYAKMYADCWTITVDDGEEDTFVEGGAYLIGMGWEGDGSWTLTPDNYIDPDNGLTVTFTSTASFKITDCVNGTTAWGFNNASYYKVANDAEGYLNLGGISATNNGSVLTPGEYTITIVNDGDGNFSHFLFTPAAGLEPAPEINFELNGYYLAGTGFTNSDSTSAEWGVRDGFLIGSDGITIVVGKNAQLQVVVCTNATTGGGNDIWKYGNSKYYNVVVASEYEDVKDSFAYFEGSNLNFKTEGTYTITVDNSGDEVLFIVTPAADLEPNLTQPIIHYYIKGNPVTGANWPELTDSKYKMTNTDGVYTLEIHLDANCEFMFWAQEEDPETGDITRSNAMIQSGALVENEYVEKTGSNMLTKVDGTYTLTYDSSTKQLTVTCVPDSTDDAGEDSTEE